MTRNFSNQRRDDRDPSSRNSSSDGYREEHSSRPARPRLSRDAVDRAWENGATRRYADYHPRQHTSMPSAQRQGRPAPAFERDHRQPQNRRPYEPRQESYGTPPSTFNRGGGYQQSEGGSRRFNGPGHRAPGSYPGTNSERWTRNPAPQRRSYGERYENERPPRFNQGSGPSERADYRNPNASRPSERPGRDGERFARGQRTGGPGARRDNYNPRWQSRPTAQQYPNARHDYSASRREYPDTRREYSTSRREYLNDPRDHSIPQREYPTSRREYSYERPGYAQQFEGDYEHFDTQKQLERAEMPEPHFEKHVTRLPDGRVLKGSRPSQRKQARFWNDVEEETSTLLPQPSKHVENSEPEGPPVSQAMPAPTTRPVRSTRSRAQTDSKPRKVKTVKTARAEDTGPRGEKAKAAKKKAHGQGPVIRPSQRGYKWPAAGE